MKVSILVSVVLFGIQDAFSKCPEETIKSCTTLFKHSFKTDHICRWTKMLDECISPYSSECVFNMEYRRAQHLVEKHGFLKCYCPDKMIKDFVEVFTNTDMCRNQDTLYEFADFFKMPACMKSHKFQSVLDLQKTLKMTC